MGQLHDPSNTGVEEGNPSALLEIRNISKAFPGCLANDDVSFTISPGEIHALLGENGAGKSTLVKIMYGVLQGDSGNIFWQGKQTKIKSPAHARRLGVGMVFQHFSLFESLTVLENIALALDDERDMKILSAKIVKVSSEYGLPLDPNRYVETLSVGERQRIEIVRCLLQDPKLLILDEPTSVLTPQEADKLFKTLRLLSSQGCAILYISHKLDEVKALCQAATVLRKGKVVGECDPRQVTAWNMAEMMVGEELRSLEKEKTPKIGKERLKVSNISTVVGTEIRHPLQNISFSVQGGEIVGIAGVSGNGQKELMALLTGEERLTIPNESILVDGVGVANIGPNRRRTLGMAFVPEERNGHGAIPNLSLADNGFLTAYKKLRLALKGIINFGATETFTEQVIKDFDVRTTGAGADAGSLSGGNLQKYIVGREILQNPSVLIAAQPTWGVDPAAAMAIRKALMKLAKEGAAVLIFSQDLDEILSICDRVAVICDGKLSEARPTGEVTIEEIGMLMGGLHDLKEGAAA